MEDGGWRLETGDWRLEIGDWRLKTGDWRLETGRRGGVSRVLSRALYSLGPFRKGRWS